MHFASYTLIFVSFKQLAILKLELLYKRSLDPKISTGRAAVLD